MVTTPNHEIGLSQNIIDERHMLRLNEGWAAAGMSTLSESVMLVGAGKSIQEAILKEQKNRDSLHNAVMQAIEEQTRYQNAALERIQKEIDDSRKELKQAQEQKQTLSEMADILKNGGTSEDLSNDPRHKAMLQRIKKENPDISDADLLILINEEYKHISALEVRLEQRIKDLEEGKEYISTLPESEDRVERIRSKMDELDLSVEDKLEMSSSAAHDANLMADGFVAAGIEEGAAQRVSDKYNTAEVNNDASSPNFMKTSVSSEISEGISGGSIVPEFMTASSAEPKPDLQPAAPSFMQPESGQPEDTAKVTM